jgi:hypothetical protein
LLWISPEVGWSFGSLRRGNQRRNHKCGKGHANENHFHCSISLLFGRSRRSNNKTEIELAIFPDFSDFLKKLRARFRSRLTPAAGATGCVQPHELILFRPGIIGVLLRSIHFGAAARLDDAPL